MIALALLSTGCLSSNLTELREADAAFLKVLTESKRSVCITLNLLTPWGQQKTTIHATGIDSGTVRCNEDGMSVTRPASAETTEK